MQKVRANKQARPEEVKKLTSGVNIKERVADLTPHMEKLVAEGTELRKWNVNGSGRNQGLAHIVDYAYARPQVTRNKKLSEMLSHRSMTGRSLRKGLGLSASDFNSKQMNKDLTAGGLTERGQKLKQRRQYVDDHMKSMMASSQDKEATGRSPEYTGLKSQMSVLDKYIRDDTFYTLTPDDSKRGRIQQVEKSAGARFKDTSPHGSEIIGVTQELDRLQAHSKTSSTVTQAKGGTFTTDTWVRTGTHSNGRAKWEFKSGQTFANTATSTRQDTDSNGSKLRVERWGPTSGSQKYSTVMGRK